MSTKLGAAFPAGFLWGVATSAFQIEGSPDVGAYRFWYRDLIAGRSRPGV